ncbi:hypothetical protein [Streptomyces sp. SMS_SU21]|uniref:hypothetical protein n=1 Tax=Streptomyces sp. SMS_SU21 TaxID=2069440 RepID=UPI001CD97D8F|nr:hypothetical protein [Streptomyces sp. SMS_SU21]MCA2205078.1 hypothetical protein [Streptomyces sp. SMS_SU21]
MDGVLSQAFREVRRLRGDRVVGRGTGLRRGEQERGEGAQAQRERGASPARA